MTNYYQIEYGSGSIYMHKKHENFTTEQEVQLEAEGWEYKVSDKGNISWRKYYREGIIGVYQGYSIRETTFNGHKQEQLSIAFKDQAEDMHYVQIQVKDQKGGLSKFAEAFIAYIPELKTGFVYRFFPYNWKKEGKKYGDPGISIKHVLDDFQTINESYKVGRMSFSYSKRGENGDFIDVPGDVPPVVWQKGIDGKSVANSLEKDTYLYTTMMNFKSDSISGGGSKKTADGPEPTPYGGGTVATEPSAAPTPAAKEPIMAHVQDRTEASAFVKTGTSNEVETGLTDSELPF